MTRQFHFLITQHQWPSTNPQVSWSINIFTKILIFSFIFYHPTESTNCNGTLCAIATDLITDYLPRSDLNMAVGYDFANDTILILGGSTYSEQFVTFNRSASMFYDEGEEYLPQWVQGWGQFYTQLDNIIWMIDSNGEKLINMNTDTRKLESPEITIPFDVDASGCLTSVRNYLFVVGGYDWNVGYKDKLQIFNISSYTWITGPRPPSMQITRRDAACIVHKNILYAISGRHAFQSDTSSIEVFDVGNDLMDIASQSWMYINDNLSMAVTGHRAVVWDDDIIVFGGRSFFNDMYLTDINVIETSTNTVKVHGSLAYQIYGAGVIVVNNILYGFGSSKYQYISLPTPSPTLSPSKPSTNPTTSPTFAPTFSPTRFPTITDAYDSYIYVVYQLSYLLHSNIRTIANNPMNAMNDMERIIEKGYIVQKQIVVTYQDFWCQIVMVDQYEIENVIHSFDTVFSDSDILQLESRILCNTPECNHLLSNYDLIKFESFVTKQLRYYFDNNTNTTSQTLEFSVISMSDEPISLMTTTEAITTTVNPRDEREKIYLPQINNLILLYETVAISFTGSSILIALLSIIDAKLCRINDYLRFVAFLSMILQTNDMLSDCFFINQFYLQNKIDMKVENDILLYVSIICIILPVLTSLFQLYFYTKRYWLQDNEHTRTWLSTYVPLLFAISILTGSSFAAVALLNSYLFKLNVFDMGLTQKQLSVFNTKRMYSIVLLENLPQLMIQSYFIISSKEANMITVSSILFSFISIIVLILSFRIQKSIFDTQSHVIITMHITGKYVNQKATKCRTISKQLQKRFSILCGVDDKTMEIVKPLFISNGLMLKMYIYGNDQNIQQIDYGKILKHAKDNGEIATFVQESWKLMGAPIISDIKTKIVQSKLQQRTNDIEMLKIHSTK